MCPEVVSCTDIEALSTRDTVHLAGVPNYTMRLCAPIAVTRSSPITRMTTASLGGHRCGPWRKGWRLMRRRRLLQPPRGEANQDATTNDAPNNMPLILFDENQAAASGATGNEAATEETKTSKKKKASGTERVTAKVLAGKVARQRRRGAEGDGRTIIQHGRRRCRQRADNKVDGDEEPML